MMKQKRYLLLALVLVVISFTGYLLHKIVIAKQQNTIVKTNMQTLPDFNFYNLDSVAVSANIVNKGRPVCIFYFNADCDYCQNEA